jgi:hypothetical protein
MTDPMNDKFLVDKVIADSAQIFTGIKGEKPIFNVVFDLWSKALSNQRLNS